MEAREEIRRLHTVCRTKDRVIKDVLSTAKVLFKKLCDKEKITEEEKAFYQASFTDFESYLG